jgi:riboflavin synthase
VFTGIVTEKGRVESAARKGGMIVFRLSAPMLARELGPGDSIAVSGVCQTATGREAGVITFDSVAETLSRTNLGDLGPGSPVNLEPAMRLGDRISGHLVTGHVDGTAMVRSRRVVQEGNIDFGLQVPEETRRFIRPKGSVCLDGVSLTVKALSGTMLEVTVIPYTLESTIIGDWRAGRAVNLEVDMIARYLAPM